MTEALPEDAVQYATSRFTDRTLPDALRKDHRTKAGVWGQLAVQSGQLLLRRDGRKDAVVKPGETAVFAPQEAHSVEALGEADFEVRFYRQEAPDAA
ncbi:DUF1971 domain-containing protein [Leisingera thetidis]|uniref:DUF1971 domain-containing protein n=1 Tax=Leisingera thetidis TaxID=2930199 RepID=UPI0021F74112|nr:DUF1971 domain-containing protein [Leisingera thetidis]